MTTDIKFRIHQLAYILDHMEEFSLRELNWEVDNISDHITYNGDSYSVEQEQSIKALAMAISKVKRAWT